MGFGDIIGGDAIGKSDLVDPYRPHATNIGQTAGYKIWQDLLGDIEDSPTFKRGESAIRDGLTRQSATARQRFGDSASAGGFMDSGAIDLGNAQINRNELDATGNALRELFLGIEERNFRNAFGYLGLSNNAEGNYLQGLLAERGQDLDFFSSLYGTTMSAGSAGAFSGGNSAIGSGSTVKGV